jgi:hypothetical protein
MPSNGGGLAALVETHNLDLAARMDRRVTIRDGRVEERGRAGIHGAAFVPPFIDSKKVGVLALGRASSD